MLSITIGDISGIIAAVVFVCRVLLPLLTSLLIAGTLKEVSSAAGWSVLGRELLLSYWPAILGGDSEARSGVPRSITTWSMARRLAAAILSIASIVTPLGLYDVISPTTNPVQSQFENAIDYSIIGNSTTPRNNLPFNRICVGDSGLVQAWVACPGQSVVIINNTDATTTNISYPEGYNMSIPQNITDVFQSGLETMSPTVSSFFDIQWRFYNLLTEEPFNNGSQYVAGVYRQADMMALNNAIEPRSGVIVDTQNGAVGFRNHSLPPMSVYGNTWSEDILFVEPETVCVDMNVTLDFYLNYTGGGDSGISMANLVLTDRGGFVNLNTTYPTYNQTNSQENVDLYNRAYKAAWLSNAISMAYLNVTNPHNGSEAPFSYIDSSIGKQFKMPPVGDTGSSVYFTYDSFMTSNTWAGYLGAPLCINCTGNSTSSSSTNYATGNYPNPFGIVSGNFTTITELCKGQGQADYANITSVAVMCGLVYGAARRSDGSTSLVFEPNANWTIPLYSCASSSRAIIKTVGFLYNGTSGLSSLDIVSVENKKYADTSDMPLWGVENTQLSVAGTSAIWGLVSAANRNLPGISVVQQESLWLPGFVQPMDSGGYITSSDNLPAAEFSSSILAYIYGLDTATTQSLSSTYDYSGQSNLGMFAQWQKYSFQANTTSKILNLIWTDLVANGLMGTRGWLTTPVSGSSNGSKKFRRAEASVDGTTTYVGITQYNRVIHYHWLYSVPAFIALAFLAMIMFASLVLCMIGHARPSAVRRHLLHTSPGRLMTTFLYPNEIDQQAPVKTWSTNIGRKHVDMSSQIPRPVDGVVMANFGLPHSGYEPVGTTRR